MMSSSASSSSTISVLFGKSDTEKEEILDRMLTRLALCDEVKLQELLFKLLPITISALSSSSQLVRNKVLEILNHVNKRITHQLEIKLPLMELWNLYIESSSAPMVMNFCIMYIEMAMDRASKEEKEGLVLSFLGLIANFPSPHQDILLRISVKEKMSKHLSVQETTLQTVLGVTNSLTVEEHLQRAMVTAKTFDGRAELASKNMVNIVLELCRAVYYPTDSKKLLLCLKLLRNLCAGELRNQNSFLEQNGIDTVATVMNCSKTKFVPDIEIIHMGLQLLGNVALAGRVHQCAIWHDFFPIKFLKIAELCSWEVCDPLCMVIYTCACDDADLIAEFCSDQGLSLIIEIVRTVYKVGLPADWVKLLLSSVCFNALFFELIFSKLYEPRSVDNFSLEQAFLLGVMSEILNDQLNDTVTIISNEFTLLIVKLLKTATETVDFITRGISRLPTGVPATDILGYCLNILRDSCASVVSDDVVRVLISSGMIGFLLNMLNDLEPPSILRKAIEKDDIGMDLSKKCVYKGFRRDIVSILGNCAYRRKQVQDEIRERNGVLVMLQQCVIDEDNPFLREWGMWSIRNLLEGNEVNQQLVTDLKIQGTVDVPEFARLGLRVTIDPETRRPKLVNV